MNQSNIEFLQSLIAIDSTNINMMVKHLPSSYKVNDVLKGVSRKEGIKELLYATDKDKEIILFTGINEPQNYKGKKYEHDDEKYIKNFLN